MNVPEKYTIEITLETKSLCRKNYIILLFVEALIRNDLADTEINMKAG
jgi:hypothetical protein